MGVIMTMRKLKSQFVIVETANGGKSVVVWASGDQGTPTIGLSSCPERIDLRRVQPWQWEPSGSKAGNVHKQPSCCALRRG